MSGLDVVAEQAAAVGVVVLIVIGFVSSYTTVRDLAVRVGEFPAWLAPVVPLSFDVGIVVLSLRVLLAARDGQPARLLRTLVLALSVATVVVNGVASDSLAGRLLHAVPSAMFVVCFETVVASARSRALGVQFLRADPRFRLARWLLAPRVTWGQWRAHVLGLNGPDSSALAAAEALHHAPPGESLPVDSAMARPGSVSSSASSGRARRGRSSMRR